MWGKNDLDSCWHTFLTCTRTQACWEDIQLWTILEPQLLLHKTFRELFFRVIQLLEPELQTAFAMTLWSLRVSLNTKLWEGKDETVAEVLLRGCSTWNVWSAAKIVEGTNWGSTTPPHETSWSKPPPGTYKCNVVAAFSPHQSSTRLGICVRDHLGQFILAKAVSICP